MKVGLVAVAGVKLQTRKFIDLGTTLPQFVNRGQVIAQLPSLALLTLAGATPPEVELEYIEVDDVASFLDHPRVDFDLVALSTYTARAFDAYSIADVSLGQDDELLDLLYPSGCRQVLIGFESPRRESLVGIDRLDWKASQHGRYLEAVEKIQACGVSVCGCFVVGLDADTPDVFGEIADFIERSRLLEVQITVLTPFPGTRLYNRLLAEGRLLYPGAWERCTLFDLNFRPKQMTVEQLEGGLMALWRDTWNAEAFAARKRYYRQLLKARRGGGQAEEADGEAEEFFALPSGG
jgi:radical SAM superfamily enzyme YgiQ (UPF0313 family)